MANSRPQQLVALLAGGLWLSGCGLIKLADPMKMPSPSASGADFVALSASGRSRGSAPFFDEGFKLGSFDVSHVKRGSTSTTTTQVGPAKSGHSSNRLRFRVSENGLSMNAQCANRTEGRSYDTGSWILDGFTASSSSTTLCNCKGPSDTAWFELGPEHGTLTLGGRAFPLEPVHQGEDGFNWGTPLGYRIGLGDTLAAVETVFPGRVWLSDRLSPADRAHTACLSAALLLNRPAELDLN